MKKQEFLDELRQLLSGEVSPEVVMDSYRYYSNYIDEEMQSGKSEEKVMEELGRPALIARSIIAAQTGAREVDEEYTEDGRTRRVRNNPFVKPKSTTDKKKTFVFDFGAWYAKVLYAFLFILLVGIVFLIIKLGFWVLVTFGIPILIVLGIIYLIMYFMK